MVKKELAMERLNLEKEYEDELVVRLHEFFINHLEQMKDITDKEREYAIRTLSVIASESEHHAFLFHEMLQSVVESDADDF